VDEIIGAFQSVWNKVVKTYKEDWKEHMIESEDGGLDSYPPRFFSESDLETEFLCLLREEFRKNSFKDTRITVKNQFRFGYRTFRDIPELAQRIKRLKHRLEKETKQNSFVPDLELDVASKDDNDPFLAFAELKYWLNMDPEYRNVQEMNKKEQGEIKRLRKQCRMLELAVEERVCENAFLCIISDGYASGNAIRYVLDSIENEFKKLHFLIDGMPLNEKKEIVNSKQKLLSD
jgi:hypothetical protein